MLTLLLTAILFYTTRQIIRSDEATRTVTHTISLDPDLEDLIEPIYTSRATFDETPYLDPKKVLAIDLSLLLP
jgi:hypothetical protein